MGDDEGATAITRRAVDLGAVDVKAIRTKSGRVRISMTMSIEQLETLIAEARAESQQQKRGVTQCDAKSQRREDSELMMLTRERDSAEYVWVSEGTRAWKAWTDYRGKAGPTTARVIDGKRYTGWYFPSLFPPAQTGAPQAAE